MNSNDTTTSETTSTSAGYDDPTVYDSSDTAEYRAKLQEVAEDDSLSMSEKEETMDDLYNEELKEVDAVYEPQTGLTMAQDDDTSNVTGDPLSASYGTTSAPAEEPVTLTPDDATSNVTGDPLSASYGTASAPAEEPVTSADSYSEEAHIVDLNETVGVAGDVKLSSVASKVDGISTMTAYDDEGNIILVKQDLDDNYSYETSIEQANGITKVSVDNDGDYHDDLVTYSDTATGQILQQDTLVDGKVTQTMADTARDGNGPDLRLSGNDGTDKFTTAEFDTDNDKISNVKLITTDETRVFTDGAVDTDNTGDLETGFTNEQIDLGSMTDLEAGLASTQFDTPAEPAQAYEPEPSYDSYDQV